MLRGYDVTLGTNLVTAYGGAAGTTPQSCPSNHNGGAGANGRIRVEYVTSLSGTTNPAASTAQVPGL
jgi:hypothetical protein